MQLRGHKPSAVFPGPKSLGGGKVAAFWNLNFDGVHSHGLSQESYIYSLIQDDPIAPKFLAHLTDNHECVIGYVLECVPAREAEIGDLNICKEVLQKLHNLGIAHGYLTKDAFLIRQDIPIAQLQFFFSSYKTIDQDILNKEMSSLQDILQYSHPQNPVHDEKLTEEITAFQQRDGYIHPVLFWQIRHEGRISLSPNDHRAMLADLEKNDWQLTTHDVQDAVERLKRNGGNWT